MPKMPPLGALHKTQWLKILYYSVELKFNFKLKIKFATILFPRGTLQAVEVVKWRAGNSALCIPVCAWGWSPPGQCWKNTGPRGGRAEREWCSEEKKNLLKGLLPTIHSPVWFWLLHNNFNPQLRKYVATWGEKSQLFAWWIIVFWMMHKQFSGSARALCQLVRVQLMNHETHSVKCSKIWTLLSVPVRQQDPPQLLEPWLPVSWVSERDFCSGGLSGEFEFSFGVNPCYHL